MKFFSIFQPHHVSVRPILILTKIIFALTLETVSELFFKKTQKTKKVFLGRGVCSGDSGGGKLKKNVFNGCELT